MTDPRQLLVDTAAMYNDWCISPFKFVPINENFCLLDCWNGTPLVCYNFTVGDHRNPWVNLCPDALDAMLIYDKEGEYIFGLENNGIPFFEIRTRRENFKIAAGIVTRYAENIVGLYPDCSVIFENV